jgi:hypothetical protein
MDDDGTAVRVKEAEWTGSYCDSAGHVLECGYTHRIGPEVGHVTHMKRMVGVGIRHAERSRIVMSPSCGKIRGASPILMNVKSVNGVRLQTFDSSDDQHLRRNACPGLEE